MRISAVAGLLVCLGLSGVLSAAEAAPDFSDMRGANYVPSYARNDVQIWLDYDPAVVDRELGYAARLKLNTVRVFLQYAVYERDRRLFLDRFESFLSLCAKHQIRMMPVVFDSCFGEFPDLEQYPRKDWMACPGQNRLGREHWPQLEQYVRDVVGGHKNDPRIALWDVMNEPTCTSFNKPADRELIWSFLRHMLDYVKQVDPQHPRTVGVEHSSLIPQVLDKLDVLATHNYRRDLREDLRAVKELGRQHGKPVIINEVAGRPQQPYSYVMPIVAEEKVGWCFWELMIGRTQFSQGPTPYQGVIYPDGTCFDAAEVMHIAFPGQQGLDPRQVARDLGVPPRRWATSEAWAWYQKQAWLVGTNYLPSSACNTTEFWQAESFDEPTIERELKLAQQTGFNTARVFLQYLVWKQDPAGFKKRFARFLELAQHSGITVMPTLFDDCSFGDPPVRQPYLGRQRELIPGLIAPSWTPSPGLDTVVDRQAWPDLQKYVQDLVGSFAKDARVVAWDLYNEPGNSGLGNKSLPLVEATFAWARAAEPSQPLTIGVWNDGLRDLNDAILARSDVITYHAYTNYQGQRGAILRYKQHQRPVLCTEWMARWLGSRWDTDLPLFKREAVGCYNWGLVNGRMQCQFGWSSKRGDPEPKVWFHDLYHRDGRPYDPQELAAIRQTTADKRIDFAAADYSKLQPDPGEVTDSDRRIKYSAGWTAWTGGGPRYGALHYHNQAGGRAEITFEGTGVQLVYKVGPDCGLAQLLLDGQPASKAHGGELPADATGAAVLDTYGAAVDWNHRVLVARNLARGTHVLTVLVTGQKNPASSNAYVQIVGADLEAEAQK